MDRLFLLTVVFFVIVAYALAFAAATVLSETLGGAWRRAATAHWTERARLAYGPGMAVLWLAVALPPFAAFIGQFAPEALTACPQSEMLGFWTAWLAAFAGVMTARVRWLRELWGPRVTFRSWLAGCLVLLLAVGPHMLITALLLVLMPREPGLLAIVMFGGAILAIAFFVLGGSILLLRLLRVVRPAPAPVTSMVEELAGQMKVPGRLQVLELHWAQLNALAWPLHRTVGFSRPLLAMLTEDELRAVAAHELAHLLESRRVRLVRTCQMFAYLPAVPLIRYGGFAGLLAGYCIFLGVFVAYKRFSRRLEQRADQLEREALADPGAYARSLVKIHEGNLLPAVMPGSQTHPHLYDRLLAGGFQPEFPRPAPPRRAKPFLATLATALATVVLLFGTLIAVGVAFRLLGLPMDRDSKAAVETVDEDAQ